MYTSLDYWKRISKRTAVSTIRNKKNTKQNLNKFIKARSQSHGIKNQIVLKSSHSLEILRFWPQSDYM